MSFERVLLKPKQQDGLKHNVNMAEVVPQKEVIASKPKRLLKITLPLLTIVVIILLVVSVFILYTMIISNESEERTRSTTYVPSKYSFPGCGQRKCQGTGLSGCPSRFRRIVHGSEATSNNWPWMAEIKIDKLHVCGGVLINRRYLVTAAHCLHVNNKPVDMSRLDVRLGSFNRILPESSRTSYAVCSYEIHDSFDTFTLQNDIALIKLKTIVQMNNFVWPACLPALQITPKSSKYGFLVGWGKENPTSALSPTLKEVEVPTVSYVSCAQSNDELFTELKVNKESHLCVGYGRKREEYACYGDSGGPFMQSVNEIWFVNGLISWIDPTCNSTLRNSYTVLTKLSYYEQWLGSNMDLPFLES